MRQKWMTFKNEFDLGILVSFVILLILTASARCQTIEAKDAKTVPHIKQHTETEEYENSIRFKTITVLSQDADLLYWAKQTKYKMQLSSFGFDKETEFPKDFKAEGCYIAVYCEKHLMLYMLIPIKCKVNTTLVGVKQ